MKKIIKFVKNINKQIVFNAFVVIAIATQFNYKIFSTKNTDILGDIISSIDQDKKDQLRTAAYLAETTRHLIEWTEVAQKNILHNEKNIETLFKNIETLFENKDINDKNIEVLFKNDNLAQEKFKILNKSREITNEHIGYIYEYINNNN